MRDWTEIGFSSIYYVLNKLEAAGWLESGGGSAEGEEQAGMLAGQSTPRGGEGAGGEPAPAPAPAALRGDSAASSGESAGGSSFRRRSDSAGGTSFHGPGVIAAGPGDSAGGPGDSAAGRAGPARRVYRLTPAGREGYREAVRERLAHPRPRTGDFDLALANLPALSPEEARAALETYRALLQERLAGVRAKWAQDAAAAAAGAAAGPHPFPPHVEAHFDHAAAGIAAELKWVEGYLDKRVRSEK